MAFTPLDVYFEAFSLIQVTALLLSMKYLMHNDLEVIWPKKRKRVYLMIYVQTSVWCESTISACTFQCSGIVHIQSLESTGFTIYCHVCYYGQVWLCKDVECEIQYILFNLSMRNSWLLWQKQYAGFIL